MIVDSLLPFMKYNNPRNKRRHSLLYGRDISSPLPLSIVPRLLSTRFVHSSLILLPLKISALKIFIEIFFESSDTAEVDRFPRVT